MTHRITQRKQRQLLISHRIFNQLFLNRIKFLNFIFILLDQVLNLDLGLVFFWAGSWAVVFKVEWCHAVFWDGFLGVVGVASEICGDPSFMLLSSATYTLRFSNHLDFILAWPNFLRLIKATIIIIKTRFRTTFSLKVLRFVEFFRGHFVEIWVILRKHLQRTAIILLTQRRRKKVRNIRLQLLGLITQYSILPIRKDISLFFVVIRHF